MSNRTMMQYFSWDLPNDGNHWKNTAADAEHLARLGITDVWLPPAYKAEKGINDVGYGVYDLYDLGEFDQKGAVRTKYGTKDEYLHAIRTLQANGIRVLADIVLNHRLGADRTEIAVATKYPSGNRLTPKKGYKNIKIKAWTVFKFSGRSRKYSDFKWNKRHFTSVDWDQKICKEGKVYKLANSQWSEEVSKENGNFDHLMGADVNYANEDVRQHLIDWGRWYLDTTGVDGFRLDAVKHIHRPFISEWLNEMREYTGRDLYTVAEYWVDHADELMGYLDKVDYAFDIFDVTLHYNFFRAAKGENVEDEHNNKYLDMRQIFNFSILSRCPENAVTFVDNHDTQPKQSLKSWVAAEFKPLAYAIILLWDAGIPCVYYGDLYGVPGAGLPAVPELEALLMARKEYAYGELKPYVDHKTTIGWTREGNGAGGMAVVMSYGGEGWKDMPLGKPGDVFVDMLGKRQDEVTIGSDGVGRFYCNGRSVSVWIPKN